MKFTIPYIFLIQNQYILSTIINRRGDVTVSDSQGQIMDADTFLKLLNPPRPSTSTANTAPDLVGASLRWAIGVDEALQPRLELHGMPTHANNLNKKFFGGDNAVSVLLGSYTLKVDMFPGSGMKGMVPIFFSPNPSQESFSEFIMAIK